MKNRLPKWKERNLFDKVFSVLVVVFALLAITFIILESVGVNVNERLDSLFLSFELLSLGVLYYKYNKPISILLLSVETLALVLTLINIFK